MPEPLPIRVALVITELEVGGAERTLVRIAQHLDRAQFSAEVYSLASRPKAGRDGLVKELEAAEIPVHFLDCDSRWSLPKAIARLRSGLRRQQAEVLLSFLFHANIVSYAANRGLKLPHVQGLRVVEQGRWRRRLQGLVGRRAERVVCVSEGVRKFAQKELGIDDAVLTVIPNAAYVPAAEERSKSTAAGPRLISVGRLDPQKGFDWLLESIPRLFERQPHAEWTILGEGPQRKALERQIERLGLLEGQVRLLGHRDDVGQHLAESDLFLLPSRWEGMPNALLEAMAAGLPVVATDVQGVAELLGPESCQIVPPEDAEAFWATVLRIIDDRPLAAALGAENRERAITRFPLVAMVAKYADMLTELSARGASGGEGD